MTDKTLLKQKIGIFLKNRKTRSIPFILLGGIIITLLAYRTSYTISPDIKYSYQLIPDEVTFYVEARNPEKLYTQIAESDFGKSIEHTEAWKKLAMTPEFKKLINIIYFLQVRTGINIEYNEIPSFLGNSIGYAGTRDNTHLLVFRTNLKSQFAMSLFKYFRGEQVYVEETPAPAAVTESKPDNEGQKPVTPEQYESPYPEERLALSNLSVSHLKMGEKDFYMAMMGDFFFLSDNLDFLKKSLLLGVDPSGSSLVRKNRMDDVMKSLESRGSIFIYHSVKHGFISPVLTALAHGSGLAAILYCDKSAAMSGDLFTIDAPGGKIQSPQLNPGWESRIPSDNMVSLVSNTAGINNACQSVRNLDSEWSFLKEGLDEYFSAMKIKPENYFGDKYGFAMCIRELRLQDDMLYPLFILGYESASTDDIFFRGIFKTAETLSRGVQSGRTFLFRPAGTGQYYNPAFYTEGNSCVITSDRDTMNSAIAASQKHRPVISDLPSFESLGAYAKAPHHLIIQVDPLIQGLKNFFYYTAEKNPDYSRATIDRDIMPLMEPFSKYQVIHMAFGMNSNPSGKIVIIPR